jgi:hypothetical protein
MAHKSGLGTSNKKDTGGTVTFSDEKTPTKKKKKNNKTPRHKRKFSEKTARQMYADDDTAAYVYRPDTNFKRTPVSDADVLDVKERQRRKEHRQDLRDAKYNRDQLEREKTPAYDRKSGYRKVRPKPTGDTPEFGQLGEETFLGVTRLRKRRAKGGSVKKYARGGGVLRKAR